MRYVAYSSRILGDERTDQCNAGVMMDKCGRLNLSAEKEQIWEINPTNLAFE
jgi:hypothetical protein